MTFTELAFLESSLGSLSTLSESEIFFSLLPRDMPAQAQALVKKMKSTPVSTDPLKALLP